MKKLVMKLDLHDEKYKRKAMQAVSCISGVNSVTIDMKEKKMTVIGDVDVVEIASKLRKLCHADLLTVGEDKKEDNKKEGDKKEGDNKKQSDDQKNKDHWKEFEEIYRRHQYLYAPPSYYYQAVPEDNPANCVIC